MNTDFLPLIACLLVAGFAISMMVYGFEGVDRYRKVHPIEPVPPLKPVRKRRTRKVS